LDLTANTKGRLVQYEKDVTYGKKIKL
jgi:hypothetical protein